MTMENWYMDEKRLKDEEMVRKAVIGMTAESRENHLEKVATHFLEDPNIGKALRKASYNATSEEKGDNPTFLSL
jgi:hypothetical protein